MKKLYFEGMMQMEERSLRITGADKTFFTKITNALTKILIPTKIGINGMLISIKRNNLLKAFESYNAENENYNKDELEKKYDTAYEAYLDSLDKYVMDSIYKKVRNGTASEFEKNAMSKYYEVTSLKEKEYMEYKYRKQKYLIELDYEGIKIGTKEKLIERYNQFYISKMDSLYKSILKNYSIKVADNTNIYDSTKEWIYTKIFYTLEEYIENILSLKIKIDYDQNLKNIISEYEKYESYMVGKLDTRDNIEKNMVLLGLSRKLFTHSLPLIVAEQCYEKLLKDARSLVQDTKIATKREKAYAMLINLIEDYNIKLLSTKVYWESPKDREEYKKFWNRYQEISKLKETDFIEYIKQKEILFIKNDMKKLDKGKTDYTKLLKYFKRKLVDYGAIREGINEKDITLDVTQRVASILKSKGYKVALTRVDDKYVSLQERVEFSENEAPEIFVSIHVNSAVAVEPKGIETHYYHDYSKELAKTVHAHLIKGIDTKDRGLFKSKFYVINHTTVPAILVEMGFISNDEERAALVTDSRKQKTAKAIAEGIIEYIKSQQSK